MSSSRSRCALESLQRRRRWLRRRQARIGNSAASRSTDRARRKRPRRWRPAVPGADSTARRARIRREFRPPPWRAGPAAGSSASSSAQHLLLHALAGKLRETGLLRGRGAQARRRRSRPCRTRHGNGTGAGCADSPRGCASPHRRRSARGPLSRSATPPTVVEHFAVRGRVERVHREIAARRRLPPNRS